MPGLIRTLVFVGVAAVAVGAAAVTHHYTRPAAAVGYDKVGESFYPDPADPQKPRYDDPNVATGLRVVSFDTDTASARIFTVEHRDGAWRLPSYHAYPAEAADQLAKTATSVFGLTRQALASRSAADHASYGVVDPLDESLERLQGRGQRVTLLKGENAIVDLIIGKNVEGAQGGADTYYVRRADEDEVYIARLDLALSTKFSEWIEPDLLQLDRSGLVALEMRRPRLDAEGELVGDEVVRLTREKSADPWKLEGLNEETEQVAADKTREVVDALDDLKIVGVRPKPDWITPELTLNPPPEFGRDAQSLQMFADIAQAELGGKGFAVVLGDDGRPKFYSQEGEFVAATDRGVAYRLHFGRLFTGTEEEIQIGKPRGNEPDDESVAAAPSAGDENRSRYLFVRAEFDAKSIGAAPVKPEAPPQPAAIDDDSQDQDAEPQEAPAAAEPAADEKPPAAAAADEKPADDPAAKARADYERAKSEYDRRLAEYESARAAYDQKVADGKRKAKELNDRFGEWYYVISAESFDELNVKRQDLVEPKGPEKDSDDDKPADVTPAAPRTGPPSPPPLPPTAGPDATDPDAAEAD
ncbi:MAG: DUF4340 domain-containing protein [Planctomycetales bacterium]